MLRVSLAGAELQGFSAPEPAASVRLLLPSSGTEELIIPAWNGNEFLLPDGRRPTLRTFTPRHLVGSPPVLDIDIVVHPQGAAARWAAEAGAGAPVAVSGPGRGYTFTQRDLTAGDDSAADTPTAVASLFLAGDETAIPAISQLLESAPAGAAIDVHLEVAHHDARFALPEHRGATVVWHDLAPGAPPGDALFGAVSSADIDPRALVWVAGEAAGVQRVRRHLFDTLGTPRGQATVRGYWKHGRSGDGGSE
jgi:NADPH-dependent ferric siderophore reductase